jgi:hypothetical protein
VHYVHTVQQLAIVATEAAGRMYRMQANKMKNANGGYGGDCLQAAAYPVKMPGWSGDEAIKRQSIDKLDDQANYAASYVDQSKEIVKVVC